MLKFQYQIKQIKSKTIRSDVFQSPFGFYCFSLIVIGLASVCCWSSLQSKLKVDLLVHQGEPECHANLWIAIFNVQGQGYIEGLILRMSFARSWSYSQWGFTYLIIITIPPPPTPDNIQLYNCTSLQNWPFVPYPVNPSTYLSQTCLLFIIVLTRSKSLIKEKTVQCLSIMYLLNHWTVFNCLW